MKILPRWSDVHEFRQQPPIYISRYSQRADTIYSWIGNIIRLKQSYWENYSSSFGIVVEVGRASLLAALWKDRHSPQEHVSVREINAWHAPHSYDLKKRMLARKVSEQELFRILDTVDVRDLPRLQ